MKYAIAILLFTSSAALASDFVVTDQDQAALQTICDIASVSTSVGRDVRAQVASYCVAWEKRVTEATKQAEKK